MTRIRLISVADASRRKALFSSLLVLAAAVLLLNWSRASFATENPTSLERLQEQEVLLAELETAQGSLAPDLVTPLRTMIELLREQSEFERAAKVQERLLTVMEANAADQSPDWIPLLKELVASRINLEETSGVAELLRQLRILNAAGGDFPELVRAVELEAHWLMTEGAGTTREQRIRSFLRAQEIISNRFGFLIDELFDKDDPRVPLWMYHIAKNNFKLYELIDVGFEGNSRTLLRLLGPPSSGPFTVKVNYLDRIEDMEQFFATAGDLQAQAMARLYAADFALRSNRSAAFEMYGEAREMLLGAGVPEDRISLYFSRPQMIPASHFHLTLEEAIAGQEADLAAWRPEGKDVTHVATYTAWNDTTPVLAAPISDHVFWDSESSYYEAILRFNISESGSVSAVDILDFEPGDRGVRRSVRRAILNKQLRPAMEEGRGQRLRDVYMRVLIPRTEE